MENKKIKIYQRGTNDDVLKEKSKEVPVDEIVSEKFQNIIKKMEQVILENDEALAVAAPQIGENWRITVISEWTLNPTRDKKKTEFKNIVFINPEIIKTSKDKKLYPEGCLSAPEVYGEVSRAKKVKVEAYNEGGGKFIRGASGLLAQTLQHEIDHLDGILFIDKAENLKKE